jgi:signal peptidase I
MFTYLIWSLTQLEIELIRHGHRDLAIQKEYEKKSKRSYQVSVWVARAISLFLCFAFAAAFASALYVRANEDRPANGIPSVKVVKSTSMAKKNEKNEYLFENKLDDQFQQFDVVICEHLPAEEDLELYDIVVYKRDDMYIIHRIVGIEEPNEKHPNERYFLLQGDAVGSSDPFPVLYSQMQGIYKGDRIPYVGSFIMFLQSPAGWLCMLLVVFVMIVTPIVERILDREKRARLGSSSYIYATTGVGRQKTEPDGAQKEMSIYYNRPGSPYCVSMQRQHEERPYRFP